MHEHGRTCVEELPRDRKPDPGATADTGNESVATCDVHVSPDSKGGLRDLTSSAASEGVAGRLAGESLGQLCA